MRTAIWPIAFHVSSLSASIANSPRVTVGGAGAPFLVLDVDGRNRIASYQAGSGSTALTFNYDVASSDFDLDGPAIAARIASACGPIFGRSQTSVTSQLPKA